GGSYRASGLTVDQTGGEQFQLDDQGTSGWHLQTDNGSTADGAGSFTLAKHGNDDFTLHEVKAAAGAVGGAADGAPAAGGNGGSALRVSDLTLDRHGFERFTLHEEGSSASLIFTIHHATLTQDGSEDFRQQDDGSTLTNGNRFGPGAVDAGTVHLVSARQGG